MQNLIQLILRYSTFWSFVIIEGLCFYMVVQFNQRQGKIFSNSVDRFVGSIYNRYDKITDYFNLGSQIEDVKKENASLRADLTKYAAFLSQGETDIDSLDGSFIFIPAKVIGKSFIGRNNNFTINKGLEDGIEEHMGVISANGVVGIVTKVNEKYALVMSNFHQKTKISAAIKDRKIHGSLVWDEMDTRYMDLDFIPDYVKVEEGDTVMTSGYSYIFPEGIVIGTVHKVAQTEKNYFDIMVKVNNTFNGLEHVYVVKDIRNRELDQLEEETDGQ